ncbi:MAG: hypothetical protein AB7E84_20435 [Xanthobacteraceae bacterium]
MLILKYFLTVGTALTIGLFLLSAHMDTGKTTSRPQAPTTATLAVVPPPPKPAVAEVSLYNEQLPPPPETRGRGRRH